jgi:hypothetical protein
MKKQSKTQKILAAATAGAFLLAGCWNDPASSSSNGSGGAMIEGQVTGEAVLAKRASQAGNGIEGATVTVAHVKADGSFEAVSSGAVQTDVDGRFSIDANAEGRGLVVIAEKAGKKWKAVISSEVKKGSTAHCRPLDVESSVEADVFAQVQADAKPVEASFADIAAHVDADIAARAQDKIEVRDFIAAQVETEADARHAVLVEAGKFSEEKIQAAEDARLEAQAKLESALDVSAGAEAKAQAQAQCDSAQLKAFADAGITLGEFAQAREAAFHAMVKASGSSEIEAGTRLAWIKKIALEHAASLKAAIDEDAKASGSGADISADAGATLDASIKASKDDQEIDSCFASFRKAVSAKLKSSFEAALGSKVMLGDSSKALLDLKASLSSATTSAQVTEAYAKFYGDAAAEIKGNIAATVGSDSAKCDALTREAILVSLQGGVGGSVKLPGFSLSGKVEGNSSGADVQVAKIKADGSLEIIPNVTAKTDDKGQFTLNTAAALPESAVVIVTKDSSKLTTLIDSKSDKPVEVTTQTTVQTQVYVKAVEQGAIVTKEEINAQVDSQVAAEVKGNDSAIVSLLASIQAASKAEASFLSEGGLGLATSSLILITSARTTAQTKLQADLKAASGDTAKVHAAYEAYHGALMDAYAKAGLDASAYARSQQVYAQALVTNSLGLIGSARVTLIRSAHSQAARGLRAATEIQLKASGAGDATVKGLVEAGAALQASVDAAASLEAIAASYETYHAAVVTSLRAAFVLQSMAIETLDGKIHAADGARGELLASVKAAVDADAVAKAHIDFAAKVETQVKGAFSGGIGGPSAAQVKSMGEVLILANMCG